MRYTIFLIILSLDVLIGGPVVLPLEQGSFTFEDESLPEDVKGKIGLDLITALERRKIQSEDSRLIVDKVEGYPLPDAVEAFLKSVNTVQGLVVSKELSTAYVSALKLLVKNKEKVEKLESFFKVLIDPDSHNLQVEDMRGMLIFPRELNHERLQKLEAKVVKRRFCYLASNKTRLAGTKVVEELRYPSCLNFGWVTYNKNRYFGCKAYFIQLKDGVYASYGKEVELLWDDGRWKWAQ